MKKRCFKCGVEKEITDFYTHSEMSDGHLGKCKECTKRDVANRYADPTARKRIRAYELKRSKEPARKKKVLQYQRTRRKRSPEKNKARRLVGQAVRNGIIKKGKCEVCGSEKTQAHHPDYKDPLRIRWLCFKHHRMEHGQKV